MKIMLVRPPSFKMPVIIPNLGLGYLAAVARADGHTVEILDCAKEKLDHDAYRSRLEKFSPNAVGIQVFTCDYSSSRRCADIAKGVDRAIWTMVGGPHPSGDPTGTMEAFTSVDFAFRGEAEMGLPKLLKYLGGSGGLELSSIEGLVYRDRGQVKMNAHGRISRLDDIPFPSWDLIDPRTYPAAPHGSFSKSLPIAPIVTTRGCPFECTYCGANVNCGRVFRTRSVENVIKEIRFLQDNFGIREVHLEDDNFTLVRSRVIEFCKRLKQENIRIDWACPNGVRLDTLDKELLEEMESAGCYSFAVGVESGSPRILELMKRRETLEVMIEKIKLVSSVSTIKMTGFFILGYPTETMEDMMKTVDLALALPIGRAAFGSFFPLPGTEIYDRLIESGEISKSECDWDLFQDNRVVYSPKGISKRQIRSLMKSAFARFYFRPAVMLGLLKEIRSLDQLKVIISRMIDSFR